MWFKPSLERPVLVPALQIHPWLPCEPGAPYPKLLYRVPTLFAVLFDLEKMCDANWGFGILRTLHDWNLSGRLPLFYLKLSPGSSFPCSSVQRLLFKLCWRKWSSSSVSFKCSPVCSRHQWDGQRVWFICLDISVCTEFRNTVGVYFVSTADRRK